MKHFAVLLLLVFSVAAAEQQVFKLPLETILKVEKVANTCAQENNVDVGLLKKIPDGTLPHDEATIKFLYCVSLKLGIINEDGHMVVEKLGGFIGDHTLAEDLKASIRKCNEITKENPLATVAEMNRCITSTAPVRFDLSH